MASGQRLYSPMPPLHALLHHLIDFAGLFPPAGLDLGTAAAEYASYRAGRDSWALGRFIIPAARLAELNAALQSATFPHHESPWRLSAIAGTDLATDLLAIEQFNAARGRAVVDTIELKVANTGAISQALASIAGRVDAYMEVPITEDPADLIEAVRQGGGRAKVRTGGVTADAFPSPTQLLRFLRRCRDAGVAFKATAGLHHPLRGAYRLTYEPDSGCAVMFGFLNVFLAAAFLEHGMGDDEALALLEESSPNSLRFEDDAAWWRSHRLGVAELRLARRFANAFGSCSFREPLDDLRAMRLL
jgi:hypothetical protein